MQKLIVYLFFKHLFSGFVFFFLLIYSWSNIFWSKTDDQAIHQNVVNIPCARWIKHSIWGLSDFFSLREKLMLVGAIVRHMNWVMSSPRNQYSYSINWLISAFLHFHIHAAIYHRFQAITQKLQKTISARKYRNILHIIIASINNSTYITYISTLYIYYLSP